MPPNEAASLAVEPSTKFRFKLGRDVLESRRAGNDGGCALRRGPPFVVCRMIEQGPSADISAKKSTWQNSKPWLPGMSDSAAPEATLPEAATARRASGPSCSAPSASSIGDIGTSPLYAMRETVAAAAGGTWHAGSAHPRHDHGRAVADAVGADPRRLRVKYVLILLRADNKGEGGTLTLVALAQRALGRRRSASCSCWAWRAPALFYGDAVITPAISVLSAVEGLKLVAPAFERLCAAGRPGDPDRLCSPCRAAAPARSRPFSARSRWSGSSPWRPRPAPHRRRSRGPAGIQPYYGVMFLCHHPALAFAMLGSVCLAVTGAEALYADLGHFGRRPIRAAWCTSCSRRSLLNYLGQGALVLAHPEPLANPFFLLAPTGLLLPLVILATLATIIASQAVITGAFSLTRQAIQLGLLPRLEIRFTSETHQGQIYLPRVNWLLLVGVVVLVLLFRSSSNLASAYGIAVFGTMVVTRCSPSWSGRAGAGSG